MRVVITGGAGFIGRHVAARLGGSHDIVQYDTYMGYDLFDSRRLAAAMKGTDMVIHLAAQTDVKRSVEDPEGTDRINIDGTADVLHTAVRAGMKRLIMASTSAVYGEGVARESMALNPKSPYGISKMKAEGIVRHGAIDYVILRFFNVYGPGQKQGIIRRFVDGNITIYNDGTMTRDFVHVWDVARAVEMSMSCPANSTYNVCTGIGTSIRKLANMFDGQAIYKQEDQSGHIHTSIGDPRKARYEMGFEFQMGLGPGLRSL